MDAVLQPGGRSPKPTIIVSPSQSKPGSDNLQNTACLLPSQSKGKKRDRGDHLTDPVKRERLLKTDDTDSSVVREENTLRSEISKITEKGGLLDSESVEKLVQLMQPDRIDRRFDLISRSVLAGVIAATDRFDCLSQFVQLKGLRVLDEWLQDVQKRKLGDLSSSKDGEKSSEEFLLVLLRALDKLPVNLNALQTSNIGRSVNHLRSHKNMEIQKKARSLVDTWKKRVEAEMNVIDAKSAPTLTASWPSKSHHQEGHGARNSGASSDIALKSSATPVSALKLASGKGSQGETTPKSTSSSPGSVKSASSPASGKEEGHLRSAAGNASDVLLSVQEDKSSSSSQSHNYNQSFSGKEDARSSATGSVTANMLSTESSRHWRSTNGFPGASVSGSPKETGSSRNSSIFRNSTQEKVSQSGVMGEKKLDVSAADGGSHKLIVKTPNSTRSPVQSKGEGSLNDHSIMSSRASSPVLSDRHGQSKSNSKKKCDTSHTTVTPDVNAELWQSNDTKDFQTGSDGGGRSLGGLPEEDNRRSAGNAERTSEVSKVASSSSRNDLLSGLHESSYSSMYALVESCAKYTETSPSMSDRDDIGMNLLASVAAGEMCKSPNDFPQGSIPPAEEVCMGEDAKSKPSPCDNYVQDRFQSNGTRCDKKAIPAIGTRSKDGIPLTNSSPIESSGDRKPTSSFSEETLEVPARDNLVVAAKFDDIAEYNSASHNRKVVKERDGNDSKQVQNAGVCNDDKTESFPDAKLQRTNSLLTEAVASNGFSGAEVVKDNRKVSVSVTLKASGSKKEVEEILKTLADMEQKPTLMADGKVAKLAVSGNDLVPQTLGEEKVGEADQDRSISCLNQSVGQTFENKTGKSTVSDYYSSSSDKSSNCTKTSVQNKDVSESCSTASSTRDKLSAYPSKDADGDVDLKESKLSDAEALKVEECTSTVADTAVSSARPLTVTAVSSARPLTVSPKMKFDLNESLNGDDGKFGEPISSSALGCLSNIYAFNTLSSTITSSAGSIPASVTVAAAAKGPFVPPVDLLRSKGELGWKGSAATSAFRPAEPRKVPQLPVVSIKASTPDESTGRPCRPLLDIDLNVADESLLEDFARRDSTAEVGSNPDHFSNNHKLRNNFAGSSPGRSFGGLDLDLNRIDEAIDIIQFPASSSRKLEAPVVPLKTVSSSSLSASEVRRDFDLNNGVDDAGAEQSSLHLQGRVSNHVLQPHATAVGIRPTNLDSGGFSAWFPPGNSYSAVTIPSVLPDRGEQAFSMIPPGMPQRILGPPDGNIFTPEIYRGSVLSSSPAVHFQSSPFPYQMFPFGTSIPLPSAAFSVGSTSYMDSSSAGRVFNPAMNSQFPAPVGSVTSQYPRHYMVSVADAATNGSVENTRMWGRQGLDLNAGPGALEVQGREERDLVTKATFGCQFTGTS